MSTFTHNDANNLIVFSTKKEAAQAPDTTSTCFPSEAELAKVSQDWPLRRFVEIFNRIPGQSPVKKFENRQKAIARVWKAMQPLAGIAQPVEPCEPTEAPAAVSAPDVAVPASRRGRKLAKQTQSATKTGPANQAVSPPKTGRLNKKAEVIALMKRAKGVTLAEIMEATGWQKHTVRGFVSILGSKGGEQVESSKNSGGDRVYQLAK